MGLQQFEQRLERLVEGVFAKAFRSGLQPVELGRRMVREMDLARSVGVRGMLAPNHFAIWVSPEDADRLAPIEQTLRRELIDAARDHARSESYRFPGPVEVEITRDPGLSKGAFRVDATMVEGGPDACLVLGDGTRIGIGNDPVTVGRASDCQVVLADPTVSKHHAQLHREGSGVVIVDLGSTNGTRVNGTAIRQRGLDDGDEVRIGAVVLRFEAT